MHRTEVDLPVTLTPGDPPLPVQLADRVRELVTSGLLRPGDRLPASRPLAHRLGVSRGTVLAGWDQLIAEGYLAAVAGSGTVVNPELASVHPRTADGAGDRRAGAGGPGRRSTGGRAAGSAVASAGGGARSPAGAGTLDLRPGRPDVRAVAGSEWRRAWRIAAAAAHQPADHDAAGLDQLREQLSVHLRRMRGVLASPDDLVVTSGARDGLATVLQVLAARDGRPSRVAVEDPGYPSLHQVPRRLGATVIGVPTDSGGMSVDSLQRAEPSPDVVLVTPSHQYPLGSAMPAARRWELLDWARRNGAVVVEDDYDSELRHVGAPLPALAALDRHERPGGDRVVTLGSFSKTVTPDLGAGFLLLPDWLRQQVIGFRKDIGPALSTVVQRALAEYLAGGGLHRHVQRMRRDYRRRRDIVVGMLAAAPGVAVYGMDGGLHAVIEWDRHGGNTDVPDATHPGTDGDAERWVVGRLADEGIEVGRLSTYWSEPTAGRRFGLVICYTGVSDADLRLALDRIATLAATRPPVRSSPTE